MVRYQKSNCWMEENYLTFDRFRDICAQLGEKDRKAHEDLALYLHSLGIALNYKDTRVYAIRMF
jgi:hypothetical protein